MIWILDIDYHNNSLGDDPYYHYFYMKHVELLNLFYIIYLTIYQYIYLLMI